LEDPGIYGKIILRWIFRKRDVGVCMDFTDVAQDMDWRRALIKALIKFCSINCGEFLD